MSYLREKMAKLTTEARNKIATMAVMVIIILAVPLSGYGVSLWSSSASPATASFADNNPYEIGVRFTSDVGGYVTGIRFYKGSANTGTHIGHLWTSTGALLASATFTNETASGWQQVSFAQPVLISANTVYVASYWDPNGNYALTRPYFTTEYNSAPLHALADATSAPNGTYYNGISSAFPTSGYDASNYWVDIVFLPFPASCISNPTISSLAPPSGPTSGGTLVTITGSGFESGAAVTFGGSNASSVTFVSATQIEAVTPAESAGSVGITITNPDTGTISLASAFSFVAPAPPPTGALLTGMTASNYSVPSGWTAVDVNGFEGSSNNGLNSGESFYGGANTETQNCTFAHTGKCSIDTYVTKSFQGIGIILHGSAINNREVDVSWWQYVQNANPGYGIGFTNWYPIERGLASPQDSIGPDWGECNPGVYACNSGLFAFFQNNAAPVGSCAAYPPPYSTSPCPWAIYSGTVNQMLGQWVQYEEHMKVNDPGIDNGDFELYQNGVLLVSVNSSTNPGPAGDQRCPLNASGTSDCGYWVGNQDFTNADLWVGGDWGAIWVNSSGDTENQNMAACVAQPASAFSPAYTADQVCPPNGNIPYFHLYIDDVIVLTKNGVE